MSYYIDVGEQDQALARPDHQGQGDPRGDPPDGRRHARPDERAAPGDGRPEARARREPASTSRRPRPSSRSSRRRVAKALQRAAGSLRRADAQQGQRRGHHPQGRRRPEAARQARSTPSSRSRSRAATSRPSYNGTMRWPMDDFTVSGNYGCSSFAVLRAGQRLRPLPQRHRPGRPVRDARSRPRPPGTVVYVGWNWADGTDPAWIVVIAHSGNLRRPGTPTCSPSARSTVGESVQEGPGHRLRGQHRQLDRRRTCTGWSSSTATS